MGFQMEISQSCIASQQLKLSTYLPEAVCQVLHAQLFLIVAHSIVCYYSAGMLELVMVQLRLSRTFDPITCTLLAGEIHYTLQQFIQ